jgi:hypothetical protein
LQETSRYIGHNLRQTSHRPDGTDAVAANAIEAALRTGKEP